MNATTASAPVTSARAALTQALRSWQFLTRRDNDLGVDLLLDALARAGYDLEERAS